MKRLYVGIDPGLTGAVALVEDSGRLFSVFDMPTIAYGRGSKDTVHGLELANELAPLLGCGEYELLAVVEEVHSMPGQGVASMFSFGMSMGVVLGVIQALHVPYILVAPQTWKKHHHLIGKPKDCARAIAQGYFPDAPLARKKDGGRADALLLAAYGRDKYFLPSAQVPVAG